MESNNNNDIDCRKEAKDLPLVNNIQKRLRRIEGQVKGLQRMIDKDACCMDILIQVSAVRAATNKVGLMILENHMQCCLGHALKGKNNDEQEKLQELIKVIDNFIK